jgi:apolipoprotein N-acyltransferase
MSRFKAVVLSAFLLFLSFPAAFQSDNLVPPALSASVVWFSLVPLLISLRGLPSGSTFRWAFLFGFLSNGGIFFWVIIALGKYGGLSVPLSVSILLLLVALMALFPATALWATARLRSRLPDSLAGPLLLTLLEWARVYVPTQGFPWATPAYSLAGALPLIQIADRVGTAGLNLLIFGTNFALAESLLRWRGRRPLPWVGAGVAGILVAGPAIYGFLQPTDRSTLSPNSSPIRVALIQGNIAQDLKWEPEEKERILEMYKHLSLAARGWDPDLTVWPEAALPYVLPAEIAAIPKLSGFLERSDLLVGAPSASGGEGRIAFRNSAFVLSPGGEVRFRYDKEHLVPFGEYVPLSDILPMHHIVPAVAGNFEAGKGETLPRLREDPYGILICYELLFPSLSVDRVRKGARFLVNITNDAWFDRTSGPFQHAAFGVFRAVETRRPIVRSANTGVTTWFDAGGRMHTPTPLFTRGWIPAEITPSSEITFYVRFPWLVPLAVLVTLSAALLIGFTREP